MKLLLALGERRPGSAPRPRPLLRVRDKGHEECGGGERRSHVIPSWQSTGPGRRVACYDTGGHEASLIEKPHGRGAGGRRGRRPARRHQHRGDGRGAADAALAPKIAAVPGFPLKTLLVATRNFEGGMPQVETVTATVDEIRTVKTPSGAFERPRDYVNQEPIIMAPGVIK